MKTQIEFYDRKRKLLRTITTEYNIYDEGDSLIFQQKDYIATSCVKDFDRKLIIITAYRAEY